MSAPEVGDRVRVIAGQWVGWEGVVVWSKFGYVAVDFFGVDLHPRAFCTCEVETVPTARTQPPQRPEEGSGVPVEAQAANGAHRGGKR